MSIKQANRGRERTGPGSGVITSAAAGSADDSIRTDNRVESLMAAHKGVKLNSGDSRAFWRHPGVSICQTPHSGDLSRDRRGRHLGLLIPLSVPNGRLAVGN